MRSHIVINTLLILAWPSLLLAQQPPGAPGQPQVRVDANRYATVSWTSPVTGGPVAYYGVRVIHEGVNFPGSPFYNVNGTSASGGPFPAGTYEVSIFAVNLWGVGTSPPTTLTIPGLTLPRAPTLLAPAVSGSTVTCSWVPALSGGTPDGYEILVTFRATDQSVMLRIGSSSNYIANYVPDGGYFVRVRAVNSVGASPWSATQSVSVGSGSVPGSPTLYEPTVSGSTVELRWEPPADDSHTSYDLQVLVVATSQVLKLRVDRSQTTLTIPGIPPGRYILWLSARNAWGLSGAAEWLIVV